MFFTLHLHSKHIQCTAVLHGFLKGTRRSESIVGGPIKHTKDMNFNQLFARFTHFSFRKFYYSTVVCLSFHKERTCFAGRVPQSAVSVNPHTSSYRTAQMWPGLTHKTKLSLPHFITVSHGNKSSEMFQLSAEQRQHWCSVLTGRCKARINKSTNYMTYTRYILTANSDRESTLKKAAFGSQSKKVSCKNDT